MPKFLTIGSPFAIAMVALLFLLQCAPPTDPNALFSSSIGGGFNGFGPKPVQIRVVLVSKSSLGTTKLIDPLDLANNYATGVVVGVSGCASGYSIEKLTVSLGIVSLYKGDTGCVVKLEGFTINSTQYALQNPSLALSNWLIGNAAVFQSTSDVNDIINVYVMQQLTPSGVVPTDQVVFTFQEIASGAGQTSPTIDPIPITVSGAEPPAFTLVQTRFLSANANGSSNYAFTLGCSSLMTGTSTSTYSCEKVLVASELDYTLIDDTFSGKALTVGQANAAFATHTAKSVFAIVPPGGSDLNGNSLNNGGFYTSDASPLISTATAVNNYNNVLLIRRLDSHGNALSYLYFYVSFPPITQH